MDIMLKWIAYVILSAAETWIGYRLFNTYLTRNSVRQRYYWLGVIFYFTFQMFSYVNESPMFSTAAYYFFFATIIAVVFFSDSLQNKITIALLFVIMNYACKTAMTGIALAWGEQTLPRELINYRIVMDPWSQMMACILFVLSLWGTICIRELRLNKQNLLYAVISYLFPLTVMISVIIISHKNIGFGSAAGIQVFYIYTSVLLFSASISLFYLLEKNILLDMSGEKSSVMEELLSLQRRHYERLDISQRELQSLRHDIKNHISCLYALLDSGHAKEAKEYIKELYTCNKGLQGIIYSGNIVIDSILSNGLANLENRGINLKCSIIIPPSLNIADVDLCILFGNLIDNAVEACERIVEPGRKKFIVLNVNIKKDYLFIDIANSFTGEVKKQNNIYRTVKIDERYCGIGLFNIRKIVEKYNGEFLYNRCHLIGYQLSAENANEKNLITGTRYFNVTGMLDFENKVADYIKNQAEDEDRHVLYRVTPYFEGNNLVATGVEMEAYSVEDNGKGICFNVYVYNVQPGIIIDYTTGKSRLAE